MRLTKILFYLFTISLLPYKKSHASFAKVYCTTENGEKKFLKGTLNKTLMNPELVALWSCNYFSPVLTLNTPKLAVNGVWKLEIVEDYFLYYFVVEGGSSTISNLKKSCQRNFGPNYIYIHPFHETFIPYFPIFYRFAYSTENFKDQLIDGYVMHPYFNNL